MTLCCGRRVMSRAGSRAAPRCARAAGRARWARAAGRAAWAPGRAAAWAPRAARTAAPGSSSAPAGAARGRWAPARAATAAERGGRGGGRGWGAAARGRRGGGGGGAGRAGGARRRGAAGRAGEVRPEPRPAFLGGQRLLGVGVAPALAGVDQVDLQEVVVGVEGVDRLRLVVDELHQSLDARVALAAGAALVGLGRVV